MTTRLNPYVFIVGCPRSGTTLLRRIADAHPQLAVARCRRRAPDAELVEIEQGLSVNGHEQLSGVEVAVAHRSPSLGRRCPLGAA